MARTACGRSAPADRCGFPHERNRRIRVTLSVLAALAAVVLFPAQAEARKGCNTLACEKRVALKQCSQKRVVPCIRYAALRYRQPVGDMLRVARCESGLNPYAVGFRIHRGLFQFNYPGTWNTTPYAGRNPFSAKWNSLAAAWMWSVGRRSEWECV